jgi:hypothetical protein
MRTKVAATLAGAIAALLAGCLSGTQPAEAAVTDVPCSPTALATALATASTGQTVSLAAGCVYVLTEGLPEVSQDLTISGHGATLERSYAAGTPAFTIMSVGSGVLTLNNVSFRNGSGAISVTDGVNPGGQLVVNGGTFTDNSGAISVNNVGVPSQVNGATFVGNVGGISNDSPATNVNVDDCTFIGNTNAFWEFGFGGSIIGSTFRGNSGAAASFSEDTGEYFADDVISNNTGDGIEDWAGSGGGGAAVDGDEISGNGGAGVYVATLQYAEVIGTKIVGNSAADGGGIEFLGGGYMDISGVTISGNSASSDGGGIDIESLPPANPASVPFVSISDSTISGNQAAAYGGGIYNQGLTDATGDQILGNAAPSGGGGIYDDGPYASFTLTNTPVLGNKPDNCEPPGSITGCSNTGITGPIMSGYHDTVCIDDAGGSAANDTPVVLDSCDGSAQQDWTIEPDATIQTSGKCLDIYRDEKTNKAKVELWTCTGGANQQWLPESGALVNPVSGKCLDDPGFNTADGTQLEIYTCNGGANQQWELP